MTHTFKPGDEVVPRQMASYWSAGRHYTVDAHRRVRDNLGSLWSADSDIFDPAPTTPPAPIDYSADRANRHAPPPTVEAKLRAWIVERYITANPDVMGDGQNAWNRALKRMAIDVLGCRIETRREVVLVKEEQI